MHKTKGRSEPQYYAEIHSNWPAMYCRRKATSEFQSTACHILFSNDRSRQPSSKSQMYPVKLWGNVHISV